jgi:arylsulfatase A-like enzyme
VSHALRTFLLLLWIHSHSHRDVTLGALDGHAHNMPYVPGPNPMPKLKRLLIEKGTTFSNAFVHTPICCPSRSSYM